jgi:putative transcriptional regulator
MTFHLSYSSMAKDKHKAKEKAEFALKLGKRIVQVRKEKGVSQAELARLCFKDKQSIQRVEAGLSIPTVFYLSELADALEIHASELLIP